MFADEQVQNLTAIVDQLIRVGKVTSTNDTNLTARVEFKDRSGIVSHNLRVLQKNTRDNKDYWMPDLDEQVLCLFLPNGIEQGYILGSPYSDVTKADVATKEKRRVKFKDGTSVEYDRSTHTLTVDVPPDGGNVVINAHTQVVVNSPEIDLGESSSLEPSVLGDKLAEWISSQLKPWLDDHVHPETQGDFTGPAKSGSTGAFDAGEGAQGGNVYSTRNRNQ